jgi:hypothetical protein
MVLKHGHFRKVYQEHVDGFEVSCWRMMKISWTDHVRNEEVLLSQGGDEYPTHKQEGKKKERLTGFVKSFVGTAF